jgi:hypothetical protein
MASTCVQVFSGQNIEKLKKNWRQVRGKDLGRVERGVKRSRGNLVLLVISTLRTIDIVAKPGEPFGFTITGSNPVRIESVDDNSPAAHLRLRPGDIIWAVNDVRGAWLTQLFFCIALTDIFLLSGWLSARQLSWPTGRLRSLCGNIAGACVCKLRSHRIFIIIIITIEGYK